MLYISSPWPWPALGPPKHQHSIWDLGGEPRGKAVHLLLTWEPTPSPCLDGCQHPAPAAHLYFPWQTPTPSCLGLSSLILGAEKVEIFGGHWGHRSQWMVICECASIVGGSKSPFTRKLLICHHIGKRLERKKSHQVYSWLTETREILLKGNTIVIVLNRWS